MTKKLISSAGLLVGIIFLAGCGQQQSTQKPQTNPTAPAVTEQNPSASQPVDTQKVFQDDALGYSVGYPGSWTYKKENSGDVTTVTFSVDVNNSPFSVYIDTIPSPVVVTTTDVEDFVKSGVKQYTNPKERVYDEKEFIYTYDDGTTITGRQFKAEYFESGSQYRLWFIAVPKDKTMLSWSYVSKIDQYDTNYNSALSMLKSWKLTK